MGDSFYRSKAPNQQYQSTEGKSYKGNPEKAKKTQNTHIHAK